jgi:histidinol dehydrogenase
MRFERLVANGSPEPLARELRALVPTGELVRDAVAEIVAHVRSRGDEALLDYTRRFDTAGAEPSPLKVDQAELDMAVESVDPYVRAAIDAATTNVRRVGEAALHSATSDPVEFGSHQVIPRSVPLARAAVYVPGGRAPYPSTVVMGVVSARIAGVEDVVVCSPPSREGDLDPVVLAACRLVGANGVYRMGGAQAIAALAYGTDSVQPVEAIVGPGNLYVQEAKRQVSSEVAIDGFAGPSDLVAVADGDADARMVALDLLAQSEHGAGTLVVGISDSTALLDALGEQLAEEAESEAVVRLVEVADLEEALALAEALAPEHLELVGPAAEQLSPRITRAGCLFVGAAAGTAFGDYVAGSNHILPTGGAARFASALSPLHFRRTFSEVRISDPGKLAKTAAPLARAEGFELHARSMEARIRENGRP